MPKCPICPHECRSYETLFEHLMQHRKNDIVTALCKLLEKQEAADKFIEACEETETITLKIGKNPQTSLEEKP